MPRFLDNYDVILLDMHGTFMFGHDRLFDPLAFVETYRRLGGNGLSGNEVAAAMVACVHGFMQRYDDPAYWEVFPSIEALMAGDNGLAGLPDREKRLVAEVFAAHECGKVPPAHAECLQAVAETHKLGLVSNICAPKDRWLAEFERAGIDDLFDVTVFSSDGNAIKPSPKIFEAAIAAFDADRARMVFVGDSLQRDIAGAQAVGLDAVWVETPFSLPDSADARPPERTITDLMELADLE